MKRIALAAVLAVAAPLVLAQESNWYAGASLGRSAYQYTCSNLPLKGFVGSCNAHDTGWRMRGGYNFNRNLGVELGYADFGAVNATGNFNLRAAVRGWTLHGVLSWPLNDQVTVFGKAGLFAAQVSANAGAWSARSNDIAPGAGIGLTYAMTDHLGLRAEWEFFNRVGKPAPSGTGKDTVDMLSVGLDYRF